MFQWLYIENEWWCLIYKRVKIKMIIKPEANQTQENIHLTGLLKSTFTRSFVFSISTLNCTFCQLAHFLSKKKKKTPKNKTCAHFLPYYWFLSIFRNFVSGYSCFGRRRRWSGRLVQESGYDETTVRHKRSAAAERRSANIPHVVSNLTQAELGQKVAKVADWALSLTERRLIIVIIFRSRRPAEERMQRVWSRAVMSER